MTLEQAVRAELVATPAVSALVGTRVWQLKLPQKPILPALRLQLIDEPIGYHMRGPDGAVRARLQIDAFESETADDPYADVTALADAVDDALTGEPFTSEGLQITGCFRNTRRVGYDADDIRVVRCMQDYTVWWRPV